MIAAAMRSGAILLAVTLAVAAPAPASAQLFFSDTPSPNLRVAPLTIRATVTPAR
jgi:hypothetical protein